MTNLTQFDKKRFMNLETYRKNGGTVRTPVGVGREGNLFYVRTDSGSPKVKRIRNNGRVRIVPSTNRGEPLGDWIEATALVLDAAGSARVHELILKKYGLVWRIVEALSRRRTKRQGRDTDWIGLQIMPNHESS